MTSGNSVFLITSVILMSVQTVSTDSLITVTCDSPSVFVGQDTYIKCSMNIDVQDKTTNLQEAILKRFGANKSIVFEFPEGKNVPVPSRFTLLDQSSPSLKLRDTVLSDEGQYKYYIKTNVGRTEAHFRINVTAYDSRVMSPPSYDITATSDDGTTKSIAAGVICVGSLIVGVLIVVIYTVRRRRERTFQEDHHVAEEEVLCDVVTESEDEPKKS